jgi:hypothetical protein
MFVEGFPENIDQVYVRLNEAPFLLSSMHSRAGVTSECCA